MKNGQRKSDGEVSQIKEDLNVRLREFERAQEALREDMADKLSLERYEDSKKQTEAKILQFSNRIRENKIRFDPLLNEMHEMRRLRDQFMDHEERFMEFQGNSQTKIVNFISQPTLQFLKSLNLSC